MASPNAMLLPPPPGTDARRPCPYCGTWNQPEFSFCQKCGRPMPQAAPGIAASPRPAPPPPSAGFLPPPPGTVLSATAGSAPEDAPVLDRSLTDAEKSSLKLAAKTGPAGGLRVFGAFLGIVPLAMIGMAFMGTPFVPENFIVIVMVSGFLGVILAAASQGLRGPLTRAVREGTGHEVYGVPEIQSASGGWSLVSISGLSIRMKSSAAARLLPGRMNRLTFADGGAATGAKRGLGSAVAYLLEANGKPVTRAELCYLVEGTGAAPPAETLAAKKAGGR